MIRDSVELEESCAACRASARELWVQRCVSGRLSWSASFRCTACGAQLEADGSDDLPENVRRAFLSESGGWRLVLLHAGERKLELVRALAKARQVASSSALGLVNARSAHLGEGTLVEMRCLEAQLADMGAQLVIERVDEL